jgi:hypothetical protein
LRCEKKSPSSGADFCGGAAFCIFHFFIASGLILVKVVSRSSLRLWIQKFPGRCHRRSAKVAGAEIQGIVHAVIRMKTFIILVWVSRDVKLRRVKNHAPQRGLRSA